MLSFSVVPRLVVTVNAVVKNMVSPFLRPPIILSTSSVATVLSKSVETERNSARSPGSLACSLFVCQRQTVFRRLVVCVCVCTVRCFVGRQVLFCIVVFKDRPFACRRVSTPITMTTKVVLSS